MKDLLRRAQPSKFEDLAAFNALYRPGALSVGMVEEFIKRKSGQKKVTYILPETRPLLEETYGVIAYQEQVMQIAVDIAGFTMGEADVLRKAMGKKKPEVMAEQKEKFVSGAVAKGFDRRKAQELWEHVEPFAGYGFNKSHSVAYAMLAYKTAYLKAHHPVAFMAAMLTSEMSSADDIAKYLQECREMSIGILPPDINESEWAFTAMADAIRFGLGAVKGLGEGAVEAVLEARGRVGRFDSLLQLASAVDLKQTNRKVFECLIKSGCFDALGSSRRSLVESLDRVLEDVQRRQREKDEGQGSLFGGGFVRPLEIEDRGEWEAAERLRYERETLGFYLSGNPLSEHRETLRRLVNHSISDLSGALGATVRIGGLVSRPRKLKIKSGPNAGRLMGRFFLEDTDGSVQVALFADDYNKFGHLIEEHAAIVVRGAVQERGGEIEVRAEQVEALDLAGTVEPAALELIIDAGASTRLLLQVRELLIEHPGQTPVSLQLELAESTVEIATEERFNVSAGETLRGALGGLLGDEAVRLRYAPKEAGV
jgi:DNA polymerase-3 subunit alpha